MQEPAEPADQVRPTKKQRELLEFIQQFIAEHGYGPSYREIMVGCNYTSVATVAVHVKNLIARGHVRKNGRSARSLEVIGAPAVTTKLQTNEVAPAEEKWLIEKLNYIFQQVEETPVVTPLQIENLQTLIAALKVLGLEGASSAYITRLSELKKRVISV